MRYSFIIHTTIAIMYTTIAQNELDQYIIEDMVKIKQSYPHRRPTSILLATLSASAMLICASTLAIDLPDLGHASAASVSLAQERRLGDTVIRQMHRSSSRYRDTQIQGFAELLIFRLSKFSKLQDRNLRLVLINNPTINAFAVPGSVVGLHLGLFLEAQSEDEFAAVLAHELAHLSQRHYARSTESQKRRLWPYIAGLLGSAVLLTQGSTDAGLAALQYTKAASIASRLSYSRNLEKEADRIGIQTLYDAGLDPNGMADMFVRMNIANRHNTRPPEFLLTHPLHENRISNARDQALRFGRKTYPDSLNYHLMRARAKLVYAKPRVAISNYRSLIKKAPNKTMRAASRYGLTLGFMKARKFTEAQQTLELLLKGDPHRLPYILLQAELWIKSGQKIAAAIVMLEQLLEINTDNLPIAELYVEALVKEKRFQEARRMLKRQTILHPENIDLWYDLAEVSGLAKDIVTVHRARAEFYLLRGDTEQATQQLNSGLRLTKENSSMRNLLQHRLNQIKDNDTTGS